ncbi:hypothetical protein C8Q79DRAFT_21272 [Trametes meyenii]|nr:hypothetical protein C8Q79DRAFT_21272 [Trametes meyenii]
MARWYPRYVDYACIVEGCGVPAADYRTPPDWKEAVLRFLPDYSHEHRLLSSIAYFIDHSILYIKRSPVLYSPVALEARNPEAYISFSQSPAKAG